MGGSSSLQASAQPRRDSDRIPLSLFQITAVAAKAHNSQIRVFGVEPELANDWYLSLKAGYPVAIPPPLTIADGLRTPAPGKVNFPIVQALVEEALTAVAPKRVAKSTAKKPVKKTALKKKEGRK